MSADLFGGLGEEAFGVENDAPAAASRPKRAGKSRQSGGSSLASSGDSSGKSKDTAGAAQPGFEEAFARLEELVSEMEQGELPLEGLIQRFEEGVGLVRHCQAFLKQAQLRVEQFIEQRDGHWVLKEIEGEAAPDKPA